MGEDFRLALTAALSILKGAGVLAPTITVSPGTEAIRIVIYDPETGPQPVAKRETPRSRSISPTTAHDRVSCGGCAKRCNWRSAPRAVRDPVGRAEPN
jgi:hypothetical protein